MELLLRIGTHLLKHLVLELEELRSQSLLENTTPALFSMMVLQVVGETIGMANLEMERLLIPEIHLLKHRVLELEELQLQYLLETIIPALFLMMRL